MVRFGTSTLTASTASNYTTMTLPPNLPHTPTPSRTPPASIPFIVETSSRISRTPVFRSIQSTSHSLSPLALSSRLRSRKLESTFESKESEPADWRSSGLDSSSPPRSTADRSQSFISRSLALFPSYIDTRMSASHTFIAPTRPYATFRSLVAKLPDHDAFDVKKRLKKISLEDWNEATTRMMPIRTKYSQGRRIAPTKALIDSLGFLLKNFTIEVPRSRQSRVRI